MDTGSDLEQMTRGDKFNARGVNVSTTTLGEVEVATKYFVLG